MTTQAISITHKRIAITLLASLTLVATLSQAQVAPPRGAGQQRPPRGRPAIRPLQPGNNNQPGAVVPTPVPAAIDPAMAALGEAIFFDSNLSTPAGQSCASCHMPEVAFSDPGQESPTSEGVIPGRFGNRNTPTASYASFVPPFRFNTNNPGPGRRNVGRGFVGGLFLDGRASTLADQAKAPFLNPLEMNNPDEATVINVIQQSDYAEDFRAVFGDTALDNVDAAFDQVALALAAFESTPEFSPFSSKFDAVRAQQAVFTPAEQRGQNLFFGRASCSTCHSSGNNPAQVFSNFRYENIGVPANQDNPFYQLDASLNPDGVNFVDLGLGGVVGFATENGKFRVPTLRNVAQTAPYMHNGVFTTLEQVVNFYNRRDVDARFGPAEVPQNVSRRGRIGNLRLNPGQVQDLVIFLRTLSD